MEEKLWETAGTSLTPYLGARIDRQALCVASTRLRQNKFVNSPPKKLLYRARIIDLCQDFIPVPGRYCFRWYYSISRLEWKLVNNVRDPQKKNGCKKSVQCFCIFDMKRMSSMHSRHLIVQIRKKTLEAPGIEPGTSSNLAERGVEPRLLRMHYTIKPCPLVMKIKLFADIYILLFFCRSRSAGGHRQYQ